MIPRWLRLLERVLLHADDREYLGGDLQEEYARRVRAGDRRGAQWHYLRNLAMASPRQGDSMVRLLWTDLRFAARSLRRRRVFTIAASLTLALGIGATTAIVSVARAVLLAALPYPAAERLLFISSSFPGATGGGDQLAYLDLRDLEARSRTIELLAGYHTGRSLVLRGHETRHAERVRANIVDPAYLELLGARTRMGRRLGPDDNRAAGAHPVVVVSHRFWQLHLAADPDAIGRTLTMSDVAFTVVGVLDPAFRDVSAEEGAAFESDVFIPAKMIDALGGSILDARAAKNFWALARLRPGVTFEQAAADVASIGEQLQREQPQANRGFTFWTHRLDAYLTQDIRSPLLLLLAGSAFVLLIACANVGNLLLAHVSARERELAVRRAIGAGRAHLVTLLFAEALLIAFCGGALGVLLAVSAGRVYRTLVPGELAPRLEGAGLDAGTLLVAAGLTIGVAVILAVLSALRASSGRAVESPGDGSRGATTYGRGWLRRGLLVLEVSTAVVLVIGAQLMLESLHQLRHTDVGFRTERLLTFEVELGTAGQRSETAVVGFGGELVSAMQQIPGVESALLWGPGRPGRNTWVTFPGRADVSPASAPRLMTWRHTISPGALGQLGLPLVSGREFNERDTPASARVAIVSQALAQTLWPNEEAVGQRLRWRAENPESPILEVVGVAADARHRGRLNSLLYPARDIYVPHAQRPERAMVGVVRSSGDPAAVAGAIREAVRRLDGAVPLFNLRTMSDHLAEEEAETRFAALLMATYGVAALVLAAIGVYGVLSYHVSLRAREMAVRLALGAERRDVVALVVRDGMATVSLGIIAGLAGAAALSRFIASLLFGVDARDPATFATVALVLIGVSLAAAALPARAATRVDPMQTLRAD